MDTTLAHLVSAAEAGSWCPELRLVAGNTLFIGTPAPPSEFLEATEYGIGEDYFNRKHPTKKTQDAIRAEAVDYAGRSMATLRQLSLEDAGNAMTLTDAQIWPASGGDGVRVPAVRVPLDAIDGWWIGGGQRLRSGGGWFFGAIIPIEGP